MAKAATYLVTLTYLATAFQAAICQSTWTVSNISDDTPDFVSLEAALSSPAVEDGDWLELAPSSASYGDLVITRPLNLRGLPDTSASGLEPIITSLLVSTAQSGQAGEISVERLTVNALTIERINATISKCKIGSIVLAEVGTASIERNWINPHTDSQIEVTGNSSVIFTNNLITISSRGVAFLSDPASQVNLVNNTIMDETGQSEWVLYRGQLVNNILTVPAGRLALFDVQTRSNLSTLKTFETESNTNLVDVEELFAGNSESIEAWLPADNGPAVGTGEGDTDIGFTGGSTPLTLNDLPGLSTLPDPPSVPEFSIVMVGIGTVTLEWSSPESVDEFELQTRIGEAPFGASATFGDESEGTLLDSLEEGTDYQFRLRAWRDELASPWVTSETITTEESPQPPPAPTIAVSSIEIGSISLEWNSSEAIDTFELQIREGDGEYAADSSYPQDSTGTTLEVPPVSEAFQFRLRSTRNDLDSDWAETAIVMALEETGPLAEYKQLFGDDLTEANSWYQSGWFEWFAADQNDYIYHLNHGSLYPIGEADTLYFFDPELGIWIWTSQLVYPSLYFYSDPPGWFLYYRGTSTPQRWFYEYATGDDTREDQF